MDSHGQGNNRVGRRSAVRRAGLAALVAGLAVAAGGRVANAQSTAASGIVGSWRVRIPRTLVNRVEEIQFLVAFFPGGVLLTSDSPVEPPAGPQAASRAVDYQGAYLGQWLQLPSGEVRATALQLNYDQRAVVTSEELVSYTFAYDGATDTLAGTWEWRETAPDGRLLFSATGPLAGARVRVEG